MNPCVLWWFVCLVGLCRYAQSYWEESTGGSEVLSKARLQAAFTDLIRSVGPGAEYKLCQEQ